MKICYTLFLFCFVVSLNANDLPDYTNEDDPDFLSPAYYNAASEDSIHLAINAIIFQCRQASLHHPLQGNTLPNYSIFRDFCDVVGRNGNYQYHPARDFYIENKATEVKIYASHSGIIDTCRSISKYRHNISITQTIQNNEGTDIAKLTTIYAHVDLDLNTVNIPVGDSVKRGDIICSHLYSGTMGGPHLHYEIRFYDKEAIGNEEFYAWNFDTPSSGPWRYGTWDTEIGIGYGNPSNYLTSTTNASAKKQQKQNAIYPNPFTNHLSISNENNTASRVEIFNASGQIVHRYTPSSGPIKVNTTHLSEGLHIIRILFIDGHYEHFPVLKKSS